MRNNECPYGLQDCPKLKNLNERIEVLEGKLDNINRTATASFITIIVTLITIIVGGMT